MYKYRYIFAFSAVMLQAVGAPLVFTNASSDESLSVFPVPVRDKGSGVPVIHIPIAVGLPANGLPVAVEVPNGFSGVYILRDSVPKPTNLNINVKDADTTVATLQRLTFYQDKGSAFGAQAAMGSSIPFAYFIPSQGTWLAFQSAALPTSTSTITNNGVITAGKTILPSISFAKQIIKY